MSNDHFVAQTYLRRFTDSSGRLHGYRKPTGAYFRCSPKDVCREWNGDINPDFQPNSPNRLGKFRKIFEPAWNKSIDSLLAGSPTDDARFAIAAYVAHLMFCTPTWVRLGQEHYSMTAKRLLAFSQRMKHKHGGPENLPDDDTIEAVKSGRIVLERDPGIIRAMLSRRLIDDALLIYHQDWVLLENTTVHPFITSDNPVAFRNEQPLNSPPIRFLPITPSHCLEIRVRRLGIRKDTAPIEERLRRRPLGNMRFARISAKYARSVNGAMSKCAEMYVLANAKSETVEKLCKANGNYEVGFDSLIIPNEAQNSEIQGIFLIVRERIGEAKKPTRKSSRQRKLE